MKLSCLIPVLLLLISSGCKKDNSTEAQKQPDTRLILKLSHTANGLPLQPDSVMYINQAGNPYSVTRLNYLISSLTLTGRSGLAVRIPGVWYLNPLAGKDSIELYGIDPGEYRSVQFSIGLDSAQNRSEILGYAPDFINMAWPDEIGGGYHFLKFEGYYKDTIDHIHGFTMHLGSTGMEVHHREIPISLTISESKPEYLNLEMNLNEWFSNPYTYNFNTDGNYTMAIPELMQHLKNNGYDVFSKK